MSEPAYDLDSFSLPQAEYTEQSRGKPELKLILGGASLASEAAATAQPAETFARAIADRLWVHIAESLPEIGSRHYKNRADHQRDYQLLPAWQQLAMHKRDPTIQALPGPIRDIILEKFIQSFKAARRPE